MLSESDKFSRMQIARQHEIATANKPAQVVRIGDRDPQTNLVQTLDACGNAALNGEKIFSSTHVSGDIVRATRASGSGLLQLDSINAGDAANAGDWRSQRTIFDNCPGYFNGQVFSCDEEEVLPPLNWILEGTATKTENTYILTTAQSYQAGGISTEKVSRLNWTLSFDYRIFGGGVNFADGLGFSYAPIAPIGGEFSEIDIGNLEDGFAVIVATYNGATISNFDRPRLQIWDQAHRHDLTLSTLAQSDLEPGLRSEQWQKLTIKYFGDKITASVGGISISATKIVPRDYQLRIIASTGFVFDGHQVKNMKFNRQRIRGRANA